jgi:predicted ATP-dependent endonuclease of OLD family
MIDWNFPQRLRLFQRDYTSKRTAIDNTPYSPKSGIEQIWDPLKSNIGITMGDVSVIGEQNVLVEGITDQIFLANCSLHAKLQGQRHLELEHHSIIPYGDETFLRSLIGVIRGKGAKAVVLMDSDTQGNKVRKYCERENIACIQLNVFAERAEGDCAIEDVFGIEEYLKWVNTFYKDFEWYQNLESASVKEQLGEKSLGKYLESVFNDRFGHSFSKISIAVLLAENLPSLTPDASKRMGTLIAKIVSAIEEE